MLCLQGMLRETGLRLEPRGRVPEVRIEGDGEASLEVRHGQILGRLRRQLRLHGMFIVLLRRMQITAQVKAC